MKSLQLNQWLKHIESFHPENIELGLERIKSVAQKLDVLDNTGQLIIVGGTNGKGSCVATLEALANNAGLNVLSYTSPHLIRFNERIRVNGEPVVDNLLVSAFQEIEQARGSVALTFFEFTTLAALWINQKLSPDLTVLEVGLGGRLDAVNIMQPDVSIITTIGLDHTDWLGDSLEQIAAEKAGISRPDKVTLIGDTNSFKLIKKTTEDTGPFPEAIFRLVRSPSQAELNTLCDVQQNPHQLVTQNVLLAVEAFELVFEEIPTDFDSMLCAIQISGRFQQIANQPLILVDVAHNPQSAENLRQQVSRYTRTHGINRVDAICGMMQDKAVAEVIEILDPVIDSWHFVDLDMPRAAPAELLVNQYQRRDLKKPVNQHVSVESAFELITSKQSKEQMILVFGSFITVGNMIQYIKANDAIDQQSE